MKKRVANDTAIDVRKCRAFQTICTKLPQQVLQDMRESLTEKDRHHERE